jgi:hypothetical protein
MSPQQDQTKDNKPGDPMENARAAVRGNPVEFTKLRANATPTELKALDAAEQEYMNELRSQQPFMFHATEQGAFSIDGQGLGSGGSLSINGMLVPSTRWNDRSIKGTLPDSISHKDVDQVVITPSGSTKQMVGSFGRPGNRSAAANQFRATGRPGASSAAATGGQTTGSGQSTGAQTGGGQNQGQNQGTSGQDKDKTK